MSKTVLITGGAGFIGSHAVEHVLVNTDWHVIVLDALTYAGNTKNFTESEHYDSNRVNFIHHDLRHPIITVAHGSLSNRKIDYVWHFASDSHVDNSLKSPVGFFKHNSEVTVMLLEWARYQDIEQFVQISTDEVYGPAKPGEEHIEWSPIIPSNPYSASKAAQEAIAIAYWRSYGVPVIITNTMNNFGERQHKEKFVPMVFDKVQKGQVVDVHAGRSKDGEWVSGSRYWLHARNHADALLWLAGHIRPVAYGDQGVDRPDRFNIAGEQRTNLEIARMIARELNSSLAFRYVDAHSKRPGHDLHYGLDSSKLEGMGWKPPVDFEEAMRRTVAWYRRNE